MFTALLIQNQNGSSLHCIVDRVSSPADPGYKQVAATELIEVSWRVRYHVTANVSHMKKLQCNFCGKVGEERSGGNEEA